MHPQDVNSLQRAGRAGLVVAVALTGLTGLTGDAAGLVESPPVQPSGERTPMVRSYRAAMPRVPLRLMYARGSGSEGVLVSAAGITGTGRRASAYVPTRTGAVFAAGDRVYDLVDGGPAVAIGPVAEHSVFLQVDPTLRYVAWEVRRADGRHARVLVYDTVAQRRVLDRVLLWADRSGPLRIASFGSARLRLVHLPREDLWGFATVSGRALVTPGGQVVDRRTRRVEGRRVSRGLWSPGLRYRVSASRGRRPWQVVDLTTGRDLTPAALRGPDLRAARLTGWLGNATLGVLASSGTWRHTTVAASVCRVAGRCRVVWRHDLGADDSGLSSSTEIG